MTKHTRIALSAAVLLSMGMSGCPSQYFQDSSLAGKWSVPDALEPMWVRIDESGKITAATTFVRSTNVTLDYASKATVSMDIVHTESGQPVNGAPMDHIDVTPLTAAAGTNSLGSARLSFDYSVVFTPGVVSAPATPVQTTESTTYTGMLNDARTTITGTVYFSTTPEGPATLDVMLDRE
jgi:hypothetical protein